MAITVPGTQRLVSAPAENVNGIGTTLVYEAVDVRRVIPTAKVPAVKAVLQTDCDSKYGIDYGGFGGTWPQRDGRGFRARFKARKTEAQVTTFLAAVETAVTT